MNLSAHGVLTTVGSGVGEHVAQSDSPPLCMECGEHPTKRHYGDIGRLSKDFGPLRVWRGSPYRWFCSNKCSGKYRGASSDMRARVLASSLVNKAKAERRVLDRLIAACKGAMDEQGKVEAKAMVRVLMQEIRRERTNTATRKWIRRKRGVAA